MKATFTVADDSPGTCPVSPFEIDVCFSGVPGTVVLEVSKIEHVGYSGSSGDPVSTQQKGRISLMRTALKASEARALASALLSAATEVKTH